MLYDLKNGLEKTLEEGSQILEKLHRNDGRDNGVHTLASLRMDLGPACIQNFHK